MMIVVSVMRLTIVVMVIVVMRNMCGIQIERVDTQLERKTTSVVRMMDVHDGVRLAKTQDEQREYHRREPESSNTTAHLSHTLLIHHEISPNWVSVNGFSTAAHKPLHHHRRVDATASVTKVQFE